MSGTQWAPAGVGFFFFFLIFSVYPEKNRKILKIFKIEFSVYICCYSSDGKAEKINRRLWWDDPTASNNRMRLPAGGCCYHH